VSLSFVPLLLYSPQLLYEPLFFLGRTACYQIILEEMMLQEAKTLGGQLSFYHELVSFEQKSAAIT
jgi:hypothetical protein